MRTIWLAIIALLVTLATTVLVTSAYAAPFVVGDVCAAACDRCVWDGADLTPSVTNVVVDAARGSAACANRICIRDVSAAIVGANNMTLACRDSTSVWGDSVAAPFSYARTAPPAPPGAIRVMP